VVEGVHQSNFLGKLHEEIPMKTRRYKEPQTVGILRRAKGGVPVAELCREHGISSASIYKCRAKYGGMDASMISQIKMLEDEGLAFCWLVEPSGPARTAIATARS
jgi:putative transposase